MTPGPDGKSPSQPIGGQFYGIIPMINECANDTDVDHFVDGKEKEKMRFDKAHGHKLKPVIVGAKVTFLNADLKMGCGCCTCQVY